MTGRLSGARHPVVLQRIRSPPIIAPMSSNISGGAILNGVTAVVAASWSEIAAIAAGGHGMNLRFSRRRILGERVRWRQHLSLPMCGCSAAGRGKRLRFRSRRDKLRRTAAPPGQAGADAASLDWRDHRRIVPESDILRRPMVSERNADRRGQPRARRSDSRHPILRTAGRSPSACRSRPDQHLTKIRTVEAGRRFPSRAGVAKAPVGFEETDLFLHYSPGSTAASLHAARDGKSGFAAAGCSSRRPSAL